MILKKMLKAALAASLVLGMSSIAMAADGMNVSGRVQSHWGQYSAGTDGYKAWFKNTTQGHVNWRASSGPMSYFMQLEIEDDNNTKSEISVTDTSSDGTKNVTKYAVPGFSKSNLNNAQAAATYKTGDLSVTIGTTSNWQSCGYTQDAGMGNTKSAQTWVMCDLYKEQDGLAVNYNIAALKGYAKLALFGSDDNAVTSVVLGGKPMDMLSFFVNQTSETPTDAATGDTGETKSTLMLGVKATFGGNMWAAFDNSTITTPSATGGDDWTRARLGLQFGMKGAGPGTIVFTYGTRQDVQGDTLSEDAVTNLVYIVDVAKGAQVRGFYTAKGTTPYAAGTAGDTTTSTFMGFGLQLTM
mgnify:CR=1 FL=1